jgi:drug/metabolite transporter (DMT)-like permease
MTPGAHKDNVPRGILFMIGATVLLALSSALAKWLVAIYPVGEVMFFRSFSSLLVCAVFILPVTGLKVFATKRPRDHIARGLSQSISQTFTPAPERRSQSRFYVAINEPGTIQRRPVLATLIYLAEAASSAIKLFDA